MRAVTAAVMLALTGWCCGQVAPRSPCPDVFKYESVDGEQGRWYGVVSLSNDSTIYSPRLNIVLDSKVELLEIWAADVTTLDNREFQIKHIKMRIDLAQALDIRFYVKYNPDLKIPRVTEIKLNSREICKVEIAQSVCDRLIYDRDVTTTVKSTIREKREFSWISLIGPQKTKPSSTSSNPDPNNWLTFIANPQPVPPAPWPVLPAPQPVLPTPQLDYRFDTDPVNPVYKDECGKVNKPDTLLFKGKPTFAGQWPWQIALYHSEHVNNKFKCGGTLVSGQHVVTAAHCVTLEGSNDLINKNALTVYLGKHNLRTSTQGVQIQFVSEVIVHPQYNASSSARDLSILKLVESVEFTEYVRPVCLWPEDQVDLAYVVGKTGNVVGWGINENGVETEEMAQVEMPVVSQDTCLRSNSKFYETVTSNTTYCAGFGSGSTACNGDSGGGMVLNLGGTWYLRGLVSLSLLHVINGCDPSNYVVFTDLAKFLPWMKEIIRLTY